MKGAKLLFSATVVCSFVSVTLLFSFLNVGFPPVFTIQVMRSIAVDSASSIIWDANPSASTMANKNEFIGRAKALKYVSY